MLNILLDLGAGIPRPQPTLAASWMGLLFLLVFGFLAYIRFTYHRRFQKLFQSIFSMRQVQQLMREELVLSHRASVLLTLSFVLLGALLLHQADAVYGWSALPAMGFSGYTMYAGLIAVVLMMRLLGVKLLQFIFAAEQPLQEYLFNLFLMNKALALIWLPIALFLTYTSVTNASVWLSVALLVFCLTLVLLLGRGIAIGFKQRLPGVYIILYLCALEIAPLAILVKWLFLG